MWVDLTEDVQELFGLMSECLDMRTNWAASGMHIAVKESHVGIRVRRVGRDPKKLEARREYQRERMRRIRLTDPTYSHRKKEAA